ncbi:MAG: hypothetical protein K8W52_40385 [Deltaproteobacteria bacterium]|nr:hypothetical protein [Deltaproteobacteria bacterium]
MSLRFAWVLALSACSPGIGRPWRPFDANATATDVIARPAVGTEDSLVGLLVPATSRWGDVAPLIASRRATLGPGDLVVATAGSFLIAPVGEARLAALAMPAVVRIALDHDARAKVASWYEAIGRVERIDGTSAAPLDLVAAFDDARARWDGYVAAETSALEAALAVAGTATPGQALGPEATRTTDVFFPSWSGGELTVIYARHLDRGSEIRVPEHVGCSKYDYQMMPPMPPSPPVPSPAACAPQMMPATVTRRAYSADLALVVAYDARGAMIHEQRFAAHGVAGPAATATAEPGGGY